MEILRYRDVWLIDRNRNPKTTKFEKGKSRQTGQPERENLFKFARKKSNKQTIEFEFPWKIKKKIISISYLIF
jgi:hypothetical protein